MRPRKREPATPIALLPVVDRLRSERPRPTAQELDRAQLRAIAQAGRAGSARRPRRGNRAVISVALAVGLMSGGTAVFAGSGGPKSASSNKSGSAANSQYCPPSSQAPGKPKKPGPAKCGHPKTKNQNK